MLRAALTIAGLDPTGGAGIAADLRAFAAADAWGLAVCAALTVQSTRGVRSVHAVAPALLEAQIRELCADVRVGAIKTGALGSAANARLVTRIAAENPWIPLVVDPVMIPSRQTGEGARLDGARALASMRKLAAAATLVTPNLDEAAALLGAPIEGDLGARDAAIALVARGARAALVKGGHGRGRLAVDWLATREQVVRLARPRLRVGPVHGTGCTLAALVAGRIASTGARASMRDDALIEAVRWAQARLDAALATPLRLGAGMRVMRVTS